MKLVGLISGGKDSCYNMMKCIEDGHTIIALANLRPIYKDEADSYMYQTVGHQVIDLYAEALGLPLYRRFIQGTPIKLDLSYEQTSGDEVEDLYSLLRQVKDELHIEGVAVGAILSEYQRCRVQHVCERLNLCSHVKLWKRNQEELLSEMIESGIEAIIIKVAALGLDPWTHLKQSLKEIYPHLLEMNRKYGLNICGEGGEYESLVLDCPLFRKKITIDECDIVIHSDDAIAPVGYLQITKARCIDKV